MKKFGTTKNEEETDIDITPMLDVVFIMLIFFIVTASFVKESGIGLNKPKVQDNSEPSEVKPIIVEVDNLNQIRIQNRLVDPRAIKPTISRLKTESPDSAVIVKVDRKSKTKAVVEAVDGIRDAGVLTPAVSVIQ